MGSNHSQHKKHHHHRRHHHHHSTDEDNLIQPNVQPNIQPNVQPNNKKHLHYKDLDKNNLNDVVKPHFAIVNPDIAKSSANPNVNTPTGYSPQQIAQAYGLNQTGSTGKNTLIAIIDAYGYPNAASDLTTYCNYYNLPYKPKVLTSSTNMTTNKNNLFAASPSGYFNFMVINMANNANTNSGWSVEQALDVQMAHAAAPQAAIVLIQATQSSFSSLYSAINTAKTLGAHVISCSWGSSESSSNASDTEFSNYNGTFTVSSGDSPGLSYPATNSSVLAVGGTSLAISNNARSSETAWYDNSEEGSGGGISSYITTNYQNVLSGKYFNYREVPDVSMVADPATGVAIYDSTYSSSNPWIQVGGTSVAAPLWAGVLAQANQIRLQNSKAILTDAKLKSFLYSTNNIPTGFYNVTHIQSSANLNVNVSGWNHMTGWGAPLNASMVATLANL